MIYALPGAAVLVGGALGYWLGKGHRWAWLVVLMSLGTAAFAWLMVTGPTLPGHDGLGRVYLAVLAVLPLETGLLIGAGIAVIRSRRDGHG